MKITTIIYTLLAALQLAAQTTIYVPSQTGTPGFVAVTAPSVSSITVSGASTPATSNPGSLIVGASTNTPSFTLVQTNWIDGATYTNSTGRTIQVWSPCKETPASVAGYATYELRVPSVTTDIVGEVTIVGTIANALTNKVGPVWVANGGTFAFTNISSGSGNSAAILNGGQYIVQ